jgi:hypothetical protein
MSPIIAVPIQLSLILDYVPDWLGPVLLAVGLVLVVVTFGTFSLSGESRSITLTGALLLCAIVGGGLMLVPFYMRRTYIFAAGLLLAGRWIEGVAATRLLSKIIRFVSGTGSGSLSAAIKRRFRRGAIVFGVLLITGWSAVWVLVLGPVVVSRTYDLTLIWTLLVGILSVLGLGFKFSSVDSRVYSVDPRFIPMVIGLILAVTGAELYNFQLFEQVLAAGSVELSISALDPILLIVGNGVYLAGYYWSARRRFQEL